MYGTFRYLLRICRKVFFFTMTAWFCKSLRRPTPIFPKRIEGLK